MDHNLYTKYLETIRLNWETGTYKNSTLLLHNTTQGHTTPSSLVAILAHSPFSPSITISQLPCSWMNVVARRGSLFIGQGGVRPGAAGLLTCVEYSRVKDSA